MFRATTNTLGKMGIKSKTHFFIGAKSRAFGGAPRSAIINCRLCLTSQRNPKPVRQSARSHSRLHPRLSSVITLSSKKKRHTALSVSFFLCIVPTPKLLRFFFYTPELPNLKRFITLRTMHNFHNFRPPNHNYPYSFLRFHYYTFYYLPNQLIVKNQRTIF